MYKFKTKVDIAAKESFAQTWGAGVFSESISDQVALVQAIWRTDEYSMSVKG